MDILGVAVSDHTVRADTGPVFSGFSRVFRPCTRSALAHLQATSWQLSQSLCDQPLTRAIFFFFFILDKRIKSNRSQVINRPASYPHYPQGAPHW